MDPCYSLWAAWMESTWAADPPARILDVCCGTGLMTQELVERGHDVVGLDASPAMLALARKRLGDRAVLIEAWLPSLPVAGPFDAAVSTLDGLNYLDLDALRATFAAIAAALRPGGWFVFDMHGGGALALMRDNPVIHGQQGDGAFTLSTTVHGRTCTTTIDFTESDTSFTETHTQHVHARDDITSALASCGFTLLAVTDEYSDAAARPHTIRVTWVARLEET